MKSEYYRWAAAAAALLALAIYVMSPAKAGSGTAIDLSNPSNFDRALSGTFETLVSCTGVVSAISSVDVKSRVGGTIEHLRLMEGDRVKKGDIIALIDKRSILLKVKQAEADLVSAKTQHEEMALSYEIGVKNYDYEMKRAILNAGLSRLNYGQIKSGSRPEEISQGRAQLSASGASLEMARRNYERQRELFSRNLVSKAALEETKANLEVAEAQARTANEKLSLLQKGNRDEEVERARLQYEVSLAEIDDIRIKTESLAMTRQKILNLKSMVDKAESLYQDAQEQLRDTTVLAPLTGVVTQKWVDEGGIITSGMSMTASGASIVTVSDMTEVWVRANVDETDISRLAIGLRARVKLDPFPKRRFAAELISIGPRVYLKNDVPSVDVILKLVEGTNEVKVGMTANADIVIDSVPGVRMVPTDSVVEKNGEKFVRVVSRNMSGQAALEMRKIKTGESNSEYTVVTDGVSDGDEFLSGIAIKREKAAGSSKSSSMGPPPPPM